MRYGILLALPLLFSFTFSPMTETIQLGKGKNSVQFQIHNNTDKTIPISIKAVQRIQNIDGKEELPQTEDIKIFPPQLIVPKGEKRSIRVDWISKKKPTMEQSYRIIAEQVPLDIDKKNDGIKGGIKMLMRFMSALYVDPGNTKSHLNIVKLESIAGKLKIHLKNSGSKHQYLKNVKIKISNGKTTIKLKKKDVEKLEGHNVLAGKTRIFEFSVDQKLNDNFEGTISVD